MSTDVLVVGGGIAGLTAAALCARAGLATTLLEAAREVGGRASTDEVDGFRFDRGAHALYAGGPATRILADLGVAVRTATAFTTGSSVLLDGEVHPLPDGFGSLVGASWLGSGGRAALAGWYARVVVGPAPTGTASEWIAPLPEPVRRVAAGLCRVASYSGELDRIDAALVQAQLRASVVHGVRYVHGGWQRLADALRDRARALGAAVLAGRAAREVGTGRVRTDDGVLEARRVILAVPPERAAELLAATLPDHPGPTRVGALQLALRDEVVRGPTRRLLVSCDAPVFVSDFTPVTPLGPDGVQVVHATHYRAGDATDPRGEVERALDAVWPGWRDGVVAERWLPSMVTAPSLPEPGRSRLPVDAVPGVLLAGDGYGGRGHLADAAFASAEEAAREVVSTLRAERAAVAAGAVA